MFEAPDFVFVYWWIISRDGSMFRFMCCTAWYFTLYSTLWQGNWNAWKKNGNSCQIPAMICSFYSAFSEKALWQAGLSGRPLHALPLDPNLAVTLAILGAPTVTSRASVKRPRLFSEIRCLNLCVSVTSSSVLYRLFSLMLILDQVTVINSSDKLIRVIQCKINLLSNTLRELPSALSAL